MEWLTQNIREERVEINTPRARLHVLPEGLAMITPGIFRDFSPEHWDRAQKRFQKLKLHAKTDEGHEHLDLPGGEGPQALNGQGDVNS